VVICLERGADLHMAQLMPLPLTVSCSSKIQIGFTFLVPAHLGSPGHRAVKRVCVCVLWSMTLSCEIHLTTELNPSQKMSHKTKTETHNKMNNIQSTRLYTCEQCSNLKWSSTIPSRRCRQTGTESCCIQPCI